MRPVRLASLSAVIVDINLVVAHDENLVVRLRAQEWRLAVRTKRVPFGVAVGAALALVSQRGWAEELTAASSADGAVRASYEAAAARSARGAAQARVDQASSAFLPKVSVSARYTRLSDFTPSPLFPFAIAATDAPAGALSPPTVSTGPVSIAPILDNYALDATLILPVTDYVLRLARGLDAAKHARDAADSRARFAWVNARVDARVARARLEHAAGRDQHAATQ